MFFEHEFNGTLTFLQLLLAFLIGVAPVAVTIAIKLSLYWRRFAEDEALPHESVKPNSRGLRSTRGRRRTRLVRRLCTTSNTNRPLPLFVTETRQPPTRHRHDN